MKVKKLSPKAVRESDESGKVTALFIGDLEKIVGASAGGCVFPGGYIHGPYPPEG